MSTDPKEEKFPYWLSAKPRIRIRQLHKQGAIIDPCSSGFIGYDKDDVVRGMEYIRLTATTGIFVSTAMRPQQFPIMLSDLLSEVLSVQLEKQVLRCLRHDSSPMPLTDIYAKASEMKRNLRLGSAHGYGAVV